MPNGFTPTPINAPMTPAPEPMSPDPSQTPMMSTHTGPEAGYIR